MLFNAFFTHFFIKMEQVPTNGKVKYVLNEARAQTKPHYALPESIHEIESCEKEIISIAYNVV